MRRHGVAEGRRRRGGKTGHVVSCARGRRRDSALSNGTATAMADVVDGLGHVRVTGRFTSSTSMLQTSCSYRAIYAQFTQTLPSRCSAPLSVICHGRSLSVFVSYSNL